MIKNFKQGATDYPVNVARLMCNIVWQARERIVKGEKPPLKELIRTFWYMYIKPTLSRADSLTSETDQYAQLIDNIVYLVKDIQVIRYEDIGFRDENQAHRRAGANANIILFSEKLGHQDFLSDIADKYNVSILALGGQPSSLIMGTAYVEDLFTIYEIGHVQSRIAQAVGRSFGGDNFAVDYEGDIYTCSMDTGKPAIRKISRLDGLVSIFAESPYSIEIRGLEFDIDGNMLINISVSTDDVPWLVAGDYLVEVTDFVPLFPF